MEGSLPLTIAAVEATAAGTQGATAASRSSASSTLALSTVHSDANFACPALRVDKWTSQRVPTFAYEFNDDQAPARFVRLDPPVATHTSELPYLFDLPDTRVQDPLNADQQKLAAGMRAAWANFAANANPSTTAVPWPTFYNNTHVMSLLPAKPQAEDFATKHHCSFWAAG
ncbi:carboxylesterase family protein [Streptomyces sp. NPDC001982]|uniref:carboxylesterase family protein n=1 Tax=unclassified Streptomyces TaxID=2593676 RepID=UPI00331C7EBB